MTVLSATSFMSRRPSTLGKVTISEGAFIGIGSVVLPNHYVGDWAVLSSGVVVIRDIEPRAVPVAGYVGRARQSPSHGIPGAQQLSSSSGDEIELDAHWADRSTLVRRPGGHGPTISAGICNRLREA